MVVHCSPKLARNRLEQCFEDAHRHRGKLHGRENERDVIFEAYRRMQSPFAATSPRGSIKGSVHASLASRNSEFIVIHGASGMGKSALARCLCDQVESIDHGYFITVQFDQCHRPEPHAALVEALTDFSRRVMKNKDARYFRDALLSPNNKADVESEFRALFDAVPDLKIMLDFANEQVTASTEESPSCSNSEVASEDFDRKVKGAVHWQGIEKGAGTSCFKDALCKFKQAIATPEKPIVFLFEDFHWADECALSVIQTLLSDTLVEGALYIGTCRSDTSTKSMNAILERFRDLNVARTDINLNALDDESIIGMLAELFRVDMAMARTLLPSMDNETRQNMFLTWEYLRELYNRKLLVFDVDTGKCCWQIDAILSTEMNVPVLIEARILQLSSAHLDYLKTAACLGSSLDASLLCRLLSCDDKDIASFLLVAEELDIVRFEDGPRRWQFAHDVIKETAYNLIPEREQSAWHYRIGRKLWRVLDSDELSHNVFLVVRQLTAFMDNMTDKKERRAVSKLCLCAGVEAVRLSMFQASLTFLEQGVELLGPQAWVDEYDTWLALLSAVAEVANSLGYFQRVHDVVPVILRHARCLRDTCRANATMVHALGSSGKYNEAIELAFSVLEKLGEKLPSKVSHWSLLIDFFWLRRQLRQKSSESLLRLPVMVDENKLAAMHMLNLLFLYALLARDELLPMLTLRMVRLTLQYGLCAVSCVGLALFASSLCT
jgi:predicted ATPase